MKLLVDEQTQGYSKEFSSIEDLMEEIKAVVDDRIIEVAIKKRAEESNSLSGETKDFP